MTQHSPADSAQQHRAAAPKQISVAVVTISDTRTAATDESGQYLTERLVAAGHQVVERLIVQDDAVQIRTAIVRLMRSAQVVLTTGGTGITGRDVTVPVIESLLTKPIPGFGELFRMLSYQQVRGAAMLSRALGGVGRGALIFAMPGSLNAVKTAWEGILEEELGHLVYEMMRQGQVQMSTVVVKEELFTDLPESVSAEPIAPHPVAERTVISASPAPVVPTPVAPSPMPSWGGEFKGVDVQTGGRQTGSVQPLGRPVGVQNQLKAQATQPREAETHLPVKLGRHTQHPTTYERPPLVRPHEHKPDDE